MKRWDSLHVGGGQSHSVLKQLHGATPGQPVLTPESEKQLLKFKFH